MVIFQCADTKGKATKGNQPKVAFFFWCDFSYFVGGG